MNKETFKNRDLENWLQLRVSNLALQLEDKQDHVCNDGFFNGVCAGRYSL